MEKYYIHLVGTGQNNGVVSIDKKFEVEQNEIGKYTSSSTSKEYIQKALDFYYPDLKSHTVNFAKVITEKVKKSNDLENFIAGAAVGHVATISKKTKKESQNNSTAYSIVNQIKGASDISFYTDEVDEIKANLDKIYNEIIDFKWKRSGQDKNENKIISENNRVLNMCVRNYATGLKKLKLSSNNTEENIHYENQFKKLKRKRFFNKYGFIVFLILALIVILITLVIRD